MDPSDAIQIVSLIILLFLSAFFSSAETALLSISQVRIRTLIEEGNKRAVTLEKVISNKGKMLSAILIGNNVVNLSASSLITTLAIKKFGNAYVGIATGVITLLILIFGAGVQLYRLQGQLRSARAEEEALAAQITQLEKENEALSEDLANAGDPELIEKIAREELGMVMQNEKVFYMYGG